MEQKEKWLAGAKWFLRGALVIGVGVLLAGAAVGFFGALPTLWAEGVTFATLGAKIGGVFAAAITGAKAWGVWAAIGGIAAGTLSAAANIMRVNSSERETEAARAQLMEISSALGRGRARDVAGEAPSQAAGRTSEEEYLEGERDQYREFLKQQAARAALPGGRNP